MTSRKKKDKPEESADLKQQVSVLQERMDRLEDLLQQTVLASPRLFPPKVKVEPMKIVKTKKGDIILPEK